MVQLLPCTFPTSLITTNHSLITTMKKFDHYHWMATNRKHQFNLVKSHKDLKKKISADSGRSFWLIGLSYLLKLYPLVYFM